MPWELITAVGALMFVVAGFQAARQAGTDSVGWVMVIATTLSCAICYELAAHKIADAIDRGTETRSPARHRTWVRLMFFGAVIFAIAAAFIGSYVSSVVLGFR
jgi:hypothetical protein